MRHRLLPRHFSPPRASGPNRRLYLPAGLLDPNADVPSYLDGTLAGDYGFDPLGLGKDGNIEKYRVAEVIHARWAMLAIPGIVIPEAHEADITPKEFDIDAAAMSDFDACNALWDALATCA